MSVGNASDLTHQAWVMESYGEIKDLRLKSIKRPVISDSDEVLIKVSAASVNPIDNLMITGYARTLLRVLRFFKNEFPLVVGRDFSGVVVEKGYTVVDFNVGDFVLGIIPLHKQGCFSEYVVTDKANILKIPENVSFAEAASITFAFLTAWSALYQSGRMKLLKSPHTKVLVLGASGGVGNQAVQLIKAEGATVVGTCSADAVPLVTSLGADYVFNYRDANYSYDVAAVGKYDIIFDCANVGFKNIPEIWKYSLYITLDAPLVRYTDNYGLIPGLALSLGSFVTSNIRAWMKGHSILWGFFSINRKGILHLQKLLEQNKLKGIVHRTIKFSDSPYAMETFAGGHVRGKIVVNYT